uniref:Gamma-tubulin complex component n=1 Tax=Timema cristinae TaxID=61476 RepID=A0A7R9DBV3_TIMCR|nr:unnamed protein product [Timema cristinae]
MIHEVIVALSGCTGSFAPENCLVSHSDMYFHPGEKTLLEKLYRIASGYKKLQDFITNNIYRREPKQVHGKDQEVQDEAGNSQPKCGMYLQAFCDGLSQTLDPYRDDLVELEKKALADPHLTLSGVFCHVDKYSELFLVLVSITEEITIQKIHGSCMLNYLNRKLNTHVDEVNILFSCHKVLFKQLTSWLLYGRIIDRYGEFFIHKVSGDSTTVSLMGTSGNTVDMNETTVPENVPDTLYPNFCDYKIRFEMLPSYIVPSLAYKILIIGQTILMFRTDSKSRNSYRYASRVLPNSPTRGNKRSGGTASWSSVAQFHVGQKTPLKEINRCKMCMCAFFVKTTLPIFRRPHGSSVGAALSISSTEPSAVNMTFEDKV